jgi:dUTP pyrophosphatase
MEVNIKKTKESAIIPTYATANSAGMDLYACLDKDSIEILPHTTQFISTGISMAIPEQYVGLIFARSGIACKRDLAPANKVGVIDSDYRGEILVALHNHSDVVQSIVNKERIAQMVIMPYIQVKLNSVDTLDNTDRSIGGFGSTGTL